MKSFDGEKFCKDLIELRGETSQQKFAEKLDINRSTLSLLETGKQVPSLEILNKVCNLGGYEPNSYFKEYQKDALIYFMGTLEACDREKLGAMMKRIKVKEKYEMLARRCLNEIR